MNLEEFLTATAVRLPTAGEIVAVCDELGLRFAVGKDGKPVFRVKKDNKDVAVLMARLLQREPWRSQVFQAKALVPATTESTAAPEPTPEPVKEVEVPSPLWARPSADARFHFADAKGRPCENGDEAVTWCWEKGPQWFSVKSHPPPKGARSCNKHLW